MLLHLSNLGILLDQIRENLYYQFDAIHFATIPIYKNVSTSICGGEKRFGFWQIVYSIKKKTLSFSLLLFIYIGSNVKFLRINVIIKFSLTPNEM